MQAAVHMYVFIIVIQKSQLQTHRKIFIAQKKNHNFIHFYLIHFLIHYTCGKFHVTLRDKILILFDFKNSLLHCKVFLFPNNEVLINCQISDIQNILNQFHLRFIISRVFVKNSVTLRDTKIPSYFFACRYLHNSALLIKIFLSYYTTTIQISILVLSIIIFRTGPVRNIILSNEFDLHDLLCFDNYVTLRDIFFVTLRDKISHPKNQQYTCQYKENSIIWDSFSNIFCKN